MSNIPSAFLPQTYTSPGAVKIQDDSSEQVILITGKLVNLGTFIGKELKFPDVPNPSYPLLLSPKEYNSLLNVFIMVWALPHSTSTIFLPPRKTLNSKLFFNN